MGALVLKFSPMDLHEFLLSPVAYLAPEKTLDGLSPAHADRRIAGTSHSIAELVAHMSFWQGLVLLALPGQRGSARSNGRPRLARRHFRYVARHSLAIRHPPQRNREACGNQHLAPDHASHRVPTARALHNRRCPRPHRHSQQPPPRTGNHATSDHGNLASTRGKLDLVASSPSWCLRSRAAFRR